MSVFFECCLFVLTTCFFVSDVQAGVGTAPASPGISAAVPAPIAASSEQHLRLSNGLEVSLIRDTRFPLAYTRLYVRTGSSNEEPTQYGISHVLEHMVFKGTKKFPKNVIDQTVKAYGGDYNAYTGQDNTCYLTDMPSSQWKTGIDIVREMAFSPALDPAELEKEKLVIISELEGGEDNVAQRLYYAMNQASMAGTVYEHKVIGTRESVMAVTSESLRNYIRRWYQPSNMLLVIAGDINLDEVRAYVESSFGDVQNESVFSQTPLIDLEKLGNSTQVAIERGPWNKVYLGISFAVPGLKDFISNDLDVLSYLLAGDGTSLFERRYHRELQLVDSIRVDNISSVRAGLFTISAVLDAGKVDSFFRNLIQDLAKLKMADFSRGELERAKFNLNDSIDRTRETLGGLISWRGVLDLELGGLQGERNLRNYQKAIGFDSLTVARDRWLRSTRAKVRVLAPQNAVLPDFSSILAKEWPDSVASGSKGDQVDIGSQELVRLKNGCNLVLIPDATVPYLSVDLLFSGGNALLDSKTQGLGTLTANLLTDGCGKMDRQSFERYLAERATSISAQSGLQTFSIEASAPSRSGEDLFALLKTMIENPHFESTELLREVGDIKAALLQRQDNPMALVGAKLQPFLFGVHPYGLDPLGSATLQDGFNSKDVLGFWKAQKAQPWTLAVCGSFDRSKVLAFAESIPSPTSPAVHVTAPAWSKEKSLELRMPGKNKAHFMLVYPTVPRTDPDAAAIMLLQSVLDGPGGLLFPQMRGEESLGYTVLARNSFQPTSGFLMFYVGTRPELVDKARASFLRIINDLKDKPLPESLLKAGSNQLEGQYYRGMQTLSSRSSAAAKEVGLGDPLNFTKELIAKTRSLTPEALQRVARRYLDNGYEVKLVP